MRLETTILAAVVAGGCRLIDTAHRCMPFRMLATAGPGANIVTMLIAESTIAAPGVRRPSIRPTEVAHWGGVFAMTLCVFALIASEFMPVSLLTPIASALDVSEGLARTFHQFVELGRCEADWRWPRPVLRSKAGAGWGSSCL